MVVLLIVIFIGFLNHFRAMYFERRRGVDDDRPKPMSRWCVAPMWLALAPLVVFGVWWPSDAVGSFHGGGPDLDRARAVTRNSKRNRSVRRN